MVSPEPPIRYYRASSVRRPAVIVVAAIVGVVALGAGAAWGLGRLGGDSTVGTVGLGAAPGEFADDETNSDGVASEPGSDPDVADGQDRPAATSMAMVGDSITDGSADAIRYVLASEGFDEITIDAVTSRRIEEGTGKGSPLSGIKSLYRLLAAGTAPDVWVIALGTNDVGLYDDQAEYRRLVTTMVEMIPDEVPLVWVDVYRAEHLTDTVVYNEILGEIVLARPDSAVVSWFAHASDPGADVLRDDQVHPNRNGTAVFASVVAEGISQVS